MAVQRRRATIRLLFDEDLPWNVAAALEVLGFNTSYVGHREHGSPPRGSPDADVLAHARRTNQIVVTSNHDLIMLCVEQGQSVIWLDPRGRQFRHDETAAVAFGGIVDWQARLAGGSEALCVRVLRTKTETLTLARANELAVRRQRVLQARRRRSRSPRPQVIGQGSLDAE